ncbi:MAG: peptide ABC transporter substrate-binding protein, partial [Clostridiales bacterium]|nr:peptide ABC transporter substrate-binding protein [Clostridiales bacterium]
MKNTGNFIRMLFSIPLVCVVLIAGCGGNAPEEPEATPIVLPTAIPEQQPETGGELLLPMPRNPFIGANGAATNALLVGTEEMRTLYSLVYEPLLRCDANNRVIASLVEKWSCDDTGRVWTFELRENVLWHDGEGVLTASDVKHTINLILAMGEESFYYPLLYQAYESMETLDNKTFTITFRRSGQMSLYALMFPVLCVRNAPETLNGTGPYKLQYAGETRVELAVNTQWWRQSPYIPTVRFLARESNDVALDSYDAGQLNMVPTSNVAAGKHREEGVTVVLDIGTQDCEALLFNHNRGTLRNLLVRQAIAHAIDRSAIVSNIYMNRAAICDVPVPPDSFLYDSTTKIYDYDPGKAETLLREAGYTEKDEDGFYVSNGRRLSLTLLVNDSTENTYRKSAAGMIASQLAYAGIEVSVVAERLSVGEENGAYEQKLAAGEFDLALVGLNLERSGNLALLLSANGIRNYGGYQSESMNTLMNAAAAAVDEKRMRETSAALQQAIVQELPFITL